MIQAFTLSTNFPKVVNTYLTIRRCGLIGNEKNIHKNANLLNEAVIGNRTVFYNEKNV